MTTAQISPAQRERLAYLELRAEFLGEVRRTDIEARFGIRPAASFRDIAAYRQLAPGNLEYDAAARAYRPASGFARVFDLPAQRVLRWLLQGYGDGVNSLPQRPLPGDMAGDLGEPELARLAVLTRALHAGHAVEIDYLSPQSGPSTRVIVPVALADNGQRWHLRARDRRREHFADFVLTRITAARTHYEHAAGHEMLDADAQWQRWLELCLVPHPALPYPAAVEADYRMSGGRLSVRLRAAMAGYLLRHWSVDCSTSHSLDPVNHPLWLSDLSPLAGIDSARLAPGYVPDAGTQPA